MKGVPQTLQSIPSVGPVFAAGIVAEIGQIEKFTNKEKIAKYAGLYWRKHQSGSFTANYTSLSRNGNQYLRYYLVEAANSVRRYLNTMIITLKSTERYQSINIKEPSS